MLTPDVLPTWDEWYMSIARKVATKSHDIRKVGAVIARPDRTPVSFGYNSFPRGVDDSRQRYEDREFKLKIVVHAELNAILNSAESLKGCTLYVTPYSPCSQCASAIVQKGIVRVVHDMLDMPPHWNESIEAAALVFKEGGVMVDYLAYEDRAEAAQERAAFARGLSQAINLLREEQVFANQNLDQVIARAALDDEKAATSAPCMSMEEYWTQRAELARSYANTLEELKS